MHSDNDVCINPPFKSKVSARGDFGSCWKFYFVGAGCRFFLLILAYWLEFRGCTSLTQSAINLQTLSGVMSFQMGLRKARTYRETEEHRSHIWNIDKKIFHLILNFALPDLRLWILSVYPKARGGKNKISRVGLEPTTSCLPLQGRAKSNH